MVEMLIKPYTLRMTSMFNKFHPQTSARNKKHILSIYLLNHILGRPQKCAKQYFAWLTMSVAEWQWYEITYHLKCFSEKSPSFIIRIWINKNLCHVWHFKWVSYNFPSLKPLPQRVHLSLYWPVWTDKWYFKFISLV